MKLLVVLQNPWARGQLRKGWNPSVWMREMRASRTGRRLVLALPRGGEWTVRFVNASPRLGKDPSALYQPDLAHLRRALRRVRPDVVLACGRLALRGISGVWSGPLVAVPHPAYRLLTNELYRTASEIVAAWTQDKQLFGKDHVRVELRQFRGRVQVEGLDG